MDPIPGERAHWGTTSFRVRVWSCLWAAFITHSLCASYVPGAVKCWNTGRSWTGHLPPGTEAEQQTKLLKEGWRYYEGPHIGMGVTLWRKETVRLLEATEDLLEQMAPELSLSVEETRKEKKDQRQAITWLKHHWSSLLVLEY